MPREKHKACVCGEKFSSDSMPGHKRHCKQWIALRAAGSEAALEEPDCAPTRSFARSPARRSSNLGLRAEPETTDSRRVDEELAAVADVQITPARSPSSSYQVKEKREEAEEKKKKNQEKTLHDSTPEFEVEPQSDLAKRVAYLDSRKRFLQPGFERDIVARCVGLIHDKRERRISDAQRESIREIEYVVRDREASSADYDPIDRDFEERAWHPLRASQPGHDADRTCKICRESRVMARAADESWIREMTQMYDTAREMGRIDQAKRDELVAELATVRPLTKVD